MASKITRKDLSDDINQLLDLIEIQDQIIKDLVGEIDKLKNDIPKRLSELENDTKYITAKDESIISKAPLDSPKFTGRVTVNGRADFAYLDNIPKKLSELDNDRGFINADHDCIKSKAPLDSPKFTGRVTINNMDIVTKNMIPTKISEFVNDAEYITVKNEIFSKKANKATAGYNKSIDSTNSYPFVVEGGKDIAAGITFDAGSYRINFGLDKDGKLKFGGGLLNDVFELAGSNNIISLIAEKGMGLLSIDTEGKLVMINGEGTFFIKYNKDTEEIELVRKEQ